MMPKYLVYTCKPVSGRQSKSVLQHLSVLNSTEFDLLCNIKSDEIKSNIEKYISKKINIVNIFSEYYKNSIVQKDNNIKSWDQVYDILDVSNLEQYDKFFIFSNLEFPSSNIKRNKNTDFPYSKNCLRWVSVGIHIINVLAILKAHNLYEIPIYEVLYDPNEMSFGDYNKDFRPKNFYKSYHGYDIPEYNLNRLDSLQSYFTFKQSKDITDFLKEEKIYDFTFGYTIFPSSNRIIYKDYLKDFANQFVKSNLYVLDKINNENTLIDTDLYLGNIKKSKYTYILPAYDTKCFSIYRLIESLYMNCLPILSKDCNLKDVEKSFNVDLSPLILKGPIEESKRLEMLYYYKSIFCKIDKSF